MIDLLYGFQGLYFCKKLFKIQQYIGGFHHRIAGGILNRICQQQKGNLDFRHRHGIQHFHIFPIGCKRFLFLSRKQGGQDFFFLFLRIYIGRLFLIPDQIIRQ